ncbi:MAG: T9SS type A sorting domain-containing protein, partial [Ekhidna sp.]|nr:T9SS type A sorting domain-containing protein [Ekhidna sp.]
AAEAVIFPNPSGRHLEVRSILEGTFKILSLSGKPLLEGTTNTKVDISSLQSGLYLVQLPDGRLLKLVRE